MRALFDETEQLLADSIRSQVDDAIPTTVDGIRAFVDESFWDSLAAGYLLGLGLPDSAGGMGTVLDATIVIAALGRAVAPVPYLGGAVMPGQLLAAAGAESGLLDDLLGGRRRLAVAFDPELAGPATGVETSVAWDAAGADSALVLDGEGNVLLVEVADDRDPLDLTRRLVDVPAAQPGERVGSLTEVDRLRWSAVAMVTVAADLVGVMTGALDLAVAHAGTRVQFGGPIGRFQAVQHLVADSHVDCEGARGLVNHAAWAIDNLDLADAVMAAHVAKAYCSEKGRLVSERVIQVHGGMGMTWECPAHLYHRRAMTDRALLGDETVHHRAIARRPAGATEPVA